MCVVRIQYRGIDTFWDRKLCMYFFLSDFLWSKCFRIFKTILHFSIFHEEKYFNTPIFCTPCVCVYVCVCVCVCVRVCVCACACVFISFHRKDFS